MRRVGICSKILCFSLFFGSLLYFSSLSGNPTPQLEEILELVKQQPKENWREEIQIIDDAINQLSELRNKELAKATRAQNQGDRLQFNTQNLLDARRYWAEADSSREIADRAQREIDKLEEKKSQIFQANTYPRRT